VIRPEARLVDRQCPAIKRFGLGQPVGGSQQFGEVVEAGRDIGVVWPDARLVDRQCPAHRRFGLGQPVGGLQQRGDVVETDRDVRMVRPEARLVDRQCPAIERFRLRVQRFRVKQQAEGAHQPCGRFGDGLSIRPFGYTLGVRGKRIEPRPGAHILRVADKGGIHPAERFGHPQPRCSCIEAPPGHVLHQAVHHEPLSLDVEGRERHSRHVGQCVLQVLGFHIGNRDVQ